MGIRMFVLNRNTYYAITYFTLRMGFLLLKYV